MKFHIRRDPSPEDVRIYANLRNYKADTHFIAESEKIVARLLRSDLEIISLYLTEEHFIAKKDLIEVHKQQSECTIFLASQEEMDGIVGFCLHQSILAAAKIPKERMVDELIVSSTKPLLFVMLDEVADAENIGSIIRTSHAMNASAIIIDGKSTSPWMRRAVRVSMGAVFGLPVVTVGSLLQTIKKLKENGIATYATTLNEQAEPIWHCDLTKHSAIVFGSEGHGIKAEIISECDGEVTIPMRDNLHSLNVSTAHGIFLYEVMKQRSLTNDKAI